MGGEDGGRGVRRHPLDADFLTDMFGSDFYTTQEAVQLQQEKMTVRVQRNFICSLCEVFFLFSVATRFQDSRNGLS